MITEPVISMYQLAIGGYLILMAVAITVKVMTVYEEKNRPGTVTPDDHTKYNQSKYIK